MSHAFPLIRCRIEQGAYATGENHVALVPRRYKADNTLPAVFYCHGKAEVAQDILNPSGTQGYEARLLNAIAERWPLFSADFGTSTSGTTQRNNYGNTNGQSRVADLKTYAQGSVGGAKTGKVILIGLSMGWLLAVNYARNNPTLVAGMVGIMPASDSDQIRDANVNGSVRADMDAAFATARTDSCTTVSGSGVVTDASSASGDVGSKVYGVGIPAAATVGSVTAGVSFTLASGALATASGAGVSLIIEKALPAGANPTTASYSGITMPPSHVYYATDDLSVLPATVTALATIIGSTPHSLGDIGTSHTDATVAAIPVQDVVDIIAGYAAAA